MKDPSPPTQQQSSHSAQAGPSSTSNGDHTKGKRSDAGSSDRGYGDESSSEGSEDGTVLFFSLPGFNKLVLALRDQGVLRFVSYLSAAAQGSRWDVSAQYEVGMFAEGDSEDEEDEATEDDGEQ